MRGLPNSDMIVDYSECHSVFLNHFRRNRCRARRSFASGRLTNLEIDNYGNVNSRLF